MRKIIIVMLMLFNVYLLFGQRVTRDEFRNFTLEEKVDYYFTYFRGIPHRTGHAIFSSDIVTYHGKAVLPFLQELMLKANYTSYYTEVMDDTLCLIAYIMYSLNAASFYPQSHLREGVEEFVLSDDEIEWFFNEYMKRIDDYILEKRMIDRVVLRNNTHLNTITTYGRHNRDIHKKFGYPTFSGSHASYHGTAIKQYFEERLGIEGLIIVPPFME